MRSNQKRVLTWCGGVSLAVAAVLMSASNAAAQVVIPPVGSFTELTSAGAPVSIVEERLEDPAPGFRAYNVWARANGGGFVNAVEDLDIAGVHQVWDVFRGNAIPTPYSNYYDGLAEVLPRLDSRVGWLDSEENAALGSVSETNDGSNPGAINPEVYDPESGLGPDDTQIGIGNVGFVNREGTDSYALALSGTPTERLLAYVVLYDGVSGADFTTADMTFSAVGGSGPSGDFAITTDPSQQQFGSFLVNDGPLVVGAGTIIPEPASGLLTLVGLVGLLGLRRRNG